MIETEFIKHFIANSNQIMWFLGAGTSRSAGMQTATDLIWDLKLKHYCLEENQILDSHDLNNQTIKDKVQSYMDSKGYPKIWSPEEYSFYFELTFGTNYQEQQKYLLDKLDKDKISLNVGHRVLAGLLSLNKARVIFTTNFDEVIESAYAQTANSNLSTYHLEGSYAALDALNQERFPLYCKIHGDFKFQSLKNLAKDLLSNDQEIQKCFIAASNRFGMVVSGYSGRDQNVMEMFRKAIQQNNPFPNGLFWTVTSIKDVAKSVVDFVTEAKNKGINAHIIETGTFDSMLSKIWRQTTGKNNAIEEKVRTALINEVNIPFPPKGKSFPILRTNALPIISIETKCAKIETKIPLSHSDVKELLQKNKSNAIINRAEHIFGWGSEDAMYKAFGKDIIVSISNYELQDPIKLIEEEKGYHAFYERAIAISLCNNKPFLFRNDKGFVLAIEPNKTNDPLFAPIAEALKDKNGKKWPIAGLVNNNPNIFWSEAVKIKLENKNNKLWLMIKPIIWIEPKIERQKNIEFIKSKTQYRYNSKTHELLNAWIKVLFGIIGNDTEIGCQIDTKYPALFKINTRTVYSQK